VYFAANSDRETETITNAPTAAPTPSPTRSDSDCVDYTVPCQFGWEGSSVDRYQCQSDGTYLLIQNCYQISWGDEFLSFDTDLWTVVDPSYVAGQTALESSSGDGHEIVFRHDRAFAKVVRSSNEIVYPLKIRATISKTADECNSWFIAMGDSYAPWSDSSVLLQWDCRSKEAALFNASYKRYDPRCWSEGEETGGSMDVTITTTNSKVTVRFDALSCSDLDVVASDLKANGITPYLWFGTFESDAALKTTAAGSASGSADSAVARFGNMLYTHFYSEFNGFNQLIWQNIPTILSGKYVVMAGGDRIIADDGYEFAIPFTVKMGIARPSDIDQINTEPRSGRYAHFIVFGATEYAARSREGVVQIVYDGLPRERMVYTAHGVFVNSTDCDWNVYGKTFNVRIQMDGQLVAVTDDFCGSTLFAKHDLNATARNQSKMALGMINSEGYTETDIITFDYIEVYQQPVASLNQLLVEGETSLSTTSTVSAIYAVSTESTTTFLGLSLVYWAIFGALALATCCCVLCLMAWCLQCGPFGNGDDFKKKKKKKKGHSAISLHEPTSVPAAERFETDTPFRDETNTQYDSTYKRSTNPRRDGDRDDIKDHEDGMSLLKDIHLVDDGARTGNVVEAQRNWMIQRQMYLQRQFIEMMMSDPNQQARLTTMGPAERRQYIQQEMAVYVAALNHNFNHLPPHIAHQQIAMMNTNFNTNMNAEGGFEGGGDPYAVATGIVGGFGGMMGTEQVAHRYNGYGGGGGAHRSQRRLDAPNIPNPYGHGPNGITPPPEYLYQQQIEQQMKPPPYGQRQKELSRPKGPSFVRMMNPNQPMPQSVHSASSQQQNPQRNHFGIGGIDSQHSQSQQRRSPRNVYSSHLPEQAQLPGGIEMGAVRGNRARGRSRKNYDIV